MKKASERKYSKRKQELIRKRGANWSFREEQFCFGIAEELGTGDMSRNLSVEEMVEMLALLLMSCKNSIVRVNDKRKRTYYKKPHQFTDKYVMLSEIIHKRDFLSKWTEQYIRYKVNRRMDNRPTLGRINHDLGYTLENIEVQPYSNNASQRAIERFSKPCIALVATKANSSAILFECPSVTNAISRINEVLDLGLTKAKLLGNIEKGLTRIDQNHSVTIISRDKLLESPMIVDIDTLVMNIIDDASVHLVSLPDVSEVGLNKIRLQIDDFGIIYVDFVSETNTHFKNTELKEEITI